MPRSGVSLILYFSALTKAVVLHLSRLVRRVAQTENSVNGSLVPKKERRKDMRNGGRDGRSYWIQGPIGGRVTLPCKSR